MKFFREAVPALAGLLLPLLLAGCASGRWPAGPPPSTIALEFEGESGWLERENVRADLAALGALGYVGGPVYRVRGLPGVKVVGFVHPGTGTYAAYYDIPAMGMNCADLGATLADGREITFGNAPRGGEIDVRPDAEKYFLPGAPIGELQQRLDARLRGQPLRKLALPDFRREFVASYGRDMAWRNAIGGVSEAEFRRIAAQDARNFTPEQLREGFERVKLGELRQRSAEALRVFRRASPLSAADRKKYGRRLVVFRDDFHPTAFLLYLRRTVPLPDAAADRYRSDLQRGLTLSELLDRITMDTGWHFTRLGRVSTPIPAEVIGVVPAASVRLAPYGAFESQPVEIRTPNDAR